MKSMTSRWVCVTLGNPCVRGFGTALAQRGFEIMSVRDANLTEKLKGRRVYLHADIIETDKNITEDAVVEWYKSVYNLCNVVEPLCRTGGMYFGMKWYAVDFVGLMMPGTVVLSSQSFTEFTEDTFLRTTALSSCGRVHLKPSLRHTGNGHRRTGKFASVGKFCREVWSWSTNAVIVCQPHISPFRELKFICIGRNFQPFFDEEGDVFRNHSGQIRAIFRRVLIGLQQKLSQIPPLWRMDLVIHNGTVYLNEIECTGAYYRMVAGNKIVDFNNLAAQSVADYLSLKYPHVGSESPTESDDRIFKTTSIRDNDDGTLT